jgi:hypothetical protein
MCICKLTVLLGPPSDPSPLLLPPLPFTYVRSLVQYRLRADTTGTSEGALVLLVLVICHVTVRITSKEVSINFVNYDRHTALETLRYGQPRRSLGPPTWLAVSKIEVNIKGLKIAFGLKAKQQ